MESFHGGKKIISSDYSYAVSVLLPVEKCKTVSSSKAMNVCGLQTKHLWNQMKLISTF